MEAQEVLLRNPQRDKINAASCTIVTERIYIAYASHCDWAIAGWVLGA